MRTGIFFTLITFGVITSFTSCFAFPSNISAGSQSVDVIIDILKAQERIYARINEFTLKNVLGLRETYPDLQPPATYTQSVRNLGPIDRLMGKLEAAKTTGKGLEVLTPQERAFIRDSVITPNTNIYAHRLGTTSNPQTAREMGQLVSAYDQAAESLFPKHIARPRTNYALQVPRNGLLEGNHVTNAIDRAIMNPNTRPGVATGDFPQKSFNIGNGKIYEPLTAMRNNTFTNIEKQIEFARKTSITTEGSAARLAHSKSIFGRTMNALAFLYTGWDIASNSFLTYEELTNLIRKLEAIKTDPYNLANARKELKSDSRDRNSTYPLNAELKALEKELRDLKRNKETMEGARKKALDSMTPEERNAFEQEEFYTANNII